MTFLITFMSGLEIERRDFFSPVINVAVVPVTSAELMLSSKIIINRICKRCGNRTFSALLKEWHLDAQVEMSILLLLWNGTEGGFPGSRIKTLTLIQVASRCSERLVSNMTSHKLFKLGTFLNHSTPSSTITRSHNKLLLLDFNHPY